MKNKKGFTLVELIVVIAILAILSVIAALAFRGIQENARAAADHANANTIASALRTVIATHGLAITDANLANAEALETWAGGADIVAADVEVTYNAGTQTLTIKMPPLVPGAPDIITVVDFDSTPRMDNAFKRLTAEGNQVRVVAPA